MDCEISHRLKSNKAFPIANGIRPKHRMVCHRGHWVPRGWIVSSHIDWRDHSQTPDGVLVRILGSKEVDCEISHQLKSGMKHSLLQMIS